MGEIELGRYFRTDLRRFWGRGTGAYPDHPGLVFERNSQNQDLRDLRYLQDFFWGVVICDSGKWMCTAGVFRKSLLITTAWS